MSKRLSAIVAVATLFATSYAMAGPALDRAHAALDDLRYEDARVALDEALREGANSPAATAEIYRLRGEVAAALGDRELAVEQFDRLLSIDPDAALREGASPKLTEPFEVARARADGRDALGLRCAIGDGAVEITVSADPLGLAAAAFQTGSGAVETAELDGGGALIVVADAAQVEQVGLIDEYGNRLVAVDGSVCERALAAERDEGQGAARSGSIVGHWALWGGAAVGFAAAGAYFGLDSRSKVDDLERLVADSAAHDFGEARALEDDARRSALFANIGFAAAGVTAIVAGVLLYRSVEREPEREGLSVVPAIGRDGAGVGLELRF